MSFGAQMFLILVKFNSPLFPLVACAQTHSLNYSSEAESQDFNVLKCLVLTMSPGDKNLCCQGICE